MSYVFLVLGLCEKCVLCILCVSRVNDVMYFVYKKNNAVRLANEDGGSPIIETHLPNLNLEPSMSLQRPLSQNRVICFKRVY